MQPPHPQLMFGDGGPQAGPHFGGPYGPGPMAPQLPPHLFSPSHHSDFRRRPSQPFQNCPQTQLSPALPLPMRQMQTASGNLPEQQHQQQLQQSSPRLTTSIRPEKSPRGSGFTIDNIIGQKSDETSSGNPASSAEDNNSCKSSSPAPSLVATNDTRPRSTTSSVGDKNVDNESAEKSQHLVDVKPDRNFSPPTPILPPPAMGGGGPFPFLYPDFSGKISGVPSQPNLMEQMIAASWRR